MIKLSNKVDLCSINVYEYLIEDVNLLNSFIEYAKNTEYTDQNSNYRSVNTYILHDKKLNNLKNVLIDCVDDAIKLIYNQVNFKAHLTQSWINLNTRFGSNSPTTAKEPTTAVRITSTRRNCCRHRSSWRRRMARWESTEALITEEQKGPDGGNHRDRGNVFS